MTTKVPEGWVELDPKDEPHFKWLLRFGDKYDRQVYFDREEADRYDEASPRVAPPRGYALSNARQGRYGWVYTDSGGWKRAQVKGVRLNEEFVPGSRAYRAGVVNSMTTPYWIRRTSGSVPVKALPEVRGLTQDGLANRAMLAQPYLAYIGSGRRKPPMKAVARLAETLRVPQIAPIADAKAAA